MIDLTNTLDLLVTLLEQMSVDYAIMGGLAVRAYSIPRATYDIDLTIALHRNRLTELYDALESQSYSIPEPYRSGWTDNVKGLQLLKLRRYVRDRSLDIDLFLAESIFQQELMQRRRIANVEERAYWIVSPEDLILLKLLASRPRDLVDVADVFFMQGELDLRYMRRWASELGIETELERAIVEGSRSQSE